MPPDAVNTTPVGDIPDGAWLRPLRRPTGWFVVGVAGCGGGRAGFTRGDVAASGAGAAGPGLGVLGFYGLETFGLNQIDGLQAQVNLANGNLVVHAADLKINAPGSGGWGASGWTGSTTAGPPAPAPSG